MWFIILNRLMVSFEYILNETKCQYYIKNDRTRKTLFSRDAVVYTYTIVSSLKMLITAASKGEGVGGSKFSRGAGFLSAHLRNGMRIFGRVTHPLLPSRSPPKTCAFPAAADINYEGGWKGGGVSGPGVCEPAPLYD